MAKRVSDDGWLFTVTLLLVFVGLVMVFSASAVIAKESYGSGYFFVLRQMGWAAAGIVTMLVAMRIDYRKIKHPAFVFLLLGLTTLMLIGVFFLDRSHNTHRWIHFGGFSFQPSEMAKPALILFLAYFLETRIQAMSDWRNTIIPALLPTLLFIGLIVFSARPGNLHRLRRDHGLHSVYCWDGYALHCLRITGVAHPTLLSDFSRRPTGGRGFWRFSIHIPTRKAEDSTSFNR